jgi:hypothetical protein
VAVNAVRVGDDRAFALPQAIKSHDPAVRDWLMTKNTPGEGRFQRNERKSGDRIGEIREVEPCYTGSATLPVSIALCEADTTRGQCANPTAPTTSPIATTIDANGATTFGIFVTGTGAVAFDPAVRFKDAGGVTCGSTSVAVRTQ